MNKIIVSLFSLGITLVGTESLALEKPEYEVLHEDGKIEYRLYNAYVVAETAVKASDGYSGASNEGFRRLFRYITGANSGETDIAMTAPVQMSMPTSGEKNRHDGASPELLARGRSKRCIHASKPVFVRKRSAAHGR